MEQNQKAQQGIRLERNKVKLDRCYGEIGIPAVKAAVECHGGGDEQTASEANEREFPWRK